MVLAAEVVCSEPKTRWPVSAEVRARQIVSSLKFAYQNDIGVFSQSRTKSFIKAMRIPVHLALIHQTFLALLNEFDRILNGQNVFVFCVVDVIHHGSEGRALTRAGSLLP